MKFRIAIELGNAAMQTGEDIASALREVAEKVSGVDGNAVDWDPYNKSGRIRDENGNAVGMWQVGR